MLTTHRVAVLDREKCDSRKCGIPCIRFCPPVRNDIEAIKMGGEGYPIISEPLCIGCGICVNKCPFNAISIVNLPQELGKDIVHQYGVNAFRIYRLAYLEKNTVVGLIGKNGIGKTTAVQILAGQIKPNLGRVDSSNIDLMEISRYFRGTLLQEYLTSLYQGNLKVSYKPQYIDKIPKVVKGKVGELLQKIASSANLEEIIEKFELKHLLDRDISVLSGGELQRLAIAVCILKDAEVYLFDEPSAYLDIKQRFKIASIIRSSLKDGARALVVDHDLAVLDYLADKIFVLYGMSSVYGVVSGPFSVREGINIFLQGYIPSENVRFRQDKIVFQVRPPSSDLEVKDSEYLYWPNMSKTYDGFKLSVKEGRAYRGEVVGIVGANGIGKTTFIKLLAGIEESDENFKLSYKSVSYKPQYPVPRDVSVEEVLRNAAGKKFDSDIYRDELLRPLRIDEMLDRNLLDLSGGELQKVVIAEALSRDAEIYLLDEPSAYLDVEERYAITKILKRITRERRAYTFLVDHDLMVLDFSSSKLMVFTGEPGRRGIADPPTDLHTGFNKFLKEMNITFRRDPDTGRPRANKLGSQLDKMQKEMGEYYYLSS
ncbi:MAG: ribosome biogenesis/translation initiation ATPase RLI [Nitrososphaeria archaeon]|nr:ribosome biogenesis/translation initiation ATPase RLI [Nitrososphaeria archaeon]